MATGNIPSTAKDKLLGHCSCPDSLSTGSNYNSTFSVIARYRPLLDVTIAGPPRCPVWCRLCGTVYQRKQPGNTENGTIVLPIPDLMVESESGSPDSHSSSKVTNNHTSISLSFGDIHA